MNRPVVGVRELKTDASRILRSVSLGAEYVVTVNGMPKAVVRPWSQADEAAVTDDELNALNQELEEIVDEISRATEGGPDSVQTLIEQREARERVLRGER